MKFVDRYVTALRSASPDLKAFLLAMALVSMTGGLVDTTFNNFLADTYKMNADARGRLEFPRELPGFLTALFAGALFFLSESRIAAASAFVTGIGMLGLAFFGGTWSAMLIFMIMWSAGAHLLMPVRDSIAMDLARNPAQRATRLGQIRGISNLALIVGCVAMWGIMRLTPHDYRIAYSVGGALALVAGFVLLALRLPGAHIQRPKFVWNRQYRLYYVMSALFGCRKQVFLTFGPWVLVKVYGQPAGVMVLLAIVAAGLGMMFQPVLGRMIDRLGERWALMGESVGIFVVCAGYGMAHYVHYDGLAVWILYVCLVGDQLLFGVSMARSTYLAKIAVRPQDIAPSLSLSVSIDHIASMTVPILGGLVWMRYGHPAVFMGAAGVAVLMFVASSCVRTPVGAAHVEEVVGGLGGEH